MPVIFAAHGAPILLDDASWMGELASWARSMPKPKSILMVSAHWEERPTTLGATRTVPLVYDFYGFPERYYQTNYPAPGAPELAARVRDLLRHTLVPCAQQVDIRGVAHEDTARPERAGPGVPQQRNPGHVPHVRRPAEDRVPLRVQQVRGRALGVGPRQQLAGQRGGGLALAVGRAEHEDAAGSEEPLEVDVAQRFPHAGRP